MGNNNNSVILRDQQLFKYDGITKLLSNAEKLDCSFYRIKKIEFVPSNLRSLQCSNNYIKKMCTLPDSLEVLICKHNWLAELDVRNTNLKTLICANNPLKYLHVPKTLKKLDCFACFGIKEINLPSLKELDCRFTPVSKLPLILKKNNCFVKSDCDLFYNSSIDALKKLRKLNKLLQKCLIAKICSKYVDYNTATQIIIIL
jgi:Leucine-rich repeat (LRR) protein